MNSGNSAPPAPDPVATAQAQGAMNVDTARVNASLNRVNQIGPDGSITYAKNGTNQPDFGTYFSQAQAAREADPAYKAMVEQNGEAWKAANLKEFEGQIKSQYNSLPGQDSYTQTTTLSPENQQLYDLSQQAKLGYSTAANQQIQSVGGMLSTAFNGQPYMNQQGAATAAGGRALQGAMDAAGRPINTDYNQIRQQSIDAANSRLQPQFQQQEDQLRTRLLNTGITEGSEAWNRAYRQMNEGQNDSRQQTILNAENLAGQSIQQTGTLRQIPLNEYGAVSQLASGYGNQAQQGLQASLAVRGQPLNEAAALLTGQQVGMPQLSNVPGVNVAPVDYAGLVGNQYQAQMAQYNQSQARGQANTGALAGTLGTAAIAGATIY